MDQFPPIPKDLLDALDKAFPERSANVGETMDTIMFRGGQRQVIRFLIAQFEEQNNTLLSDRITPHGTF